MHRGVYTVTLERQPALARECGMGCETTGSKYRDIAGEVRVWMTREETLDYAGAERDDVFLVMAIQMQGHMANIIDRDR